MKVMRPVVERYVEAEMVNALLHADQQDHGLVVRYMYDGKSQVTVSIGVCR